MLQMVSMMMGHAEKGEPCRGIKHVPIPVETSDFAIKL